MFIGIQILRGLAAAMVVCHHYLASQVERGAAVSHWWLEFGGSGVDIFFVISGFIMMITQSDASGKKREYSARNFLTRRLMRIAPLYWVLTALAFGLASLAGAAVNTQISGEKFLMSMLFLPYSEGDIVMNQDAHTAYVIPMAWTLTFEWFFYLVFASALAFGLHSYARLRFIAVVFIALVAAGLLARPEAPILQVITSPLLFEFLLGCAVAVFYLKGLRLHPAIAVALAVTAVGVLVNQLHGTVFERTAIWGLASFGLVMAASLTERELGQSIAIKPFARLGDISYSLYLSHFFTLALFVRLQDRLPPLNESFGIPAIVAFAALNIFVAEMCYRFIEDPSRKFFARADFSWLRPKRKVPGP